MTTEGKYQYKRPFRLRILAACLHKEWYARVGMSVVKPEYFDTKEEMELVRFINDFCTTQHRTPSEDEIFAEFTPCDELMNDLLCEVIELLDTKPDELEYAKSKVIDFAKHQTQGIAFGLGASLWDRNEDIAEAVQMLHDAERIGADAADMGLHLVNDADAWIYPDYENELDRIATGMPQLDKAMGGGIGKGEYHLVVGPPGSGKTRTLVNFGIGAASHTSKANVLHITLEMSAKKVARRYGARLTGQMLERDNEIIFKRNLEHAASLKLRGCIRIKQYPNRRLTMTELNRYLDTLLLEGFEPDLIIVDYSTNMRHDSHAGEYRHQLADTTENLRGLAVERNIGIWDAAQANRAAFKKEIVDLDDIAECIDQTATADGVFTVCQTKTEKASDVLRLYNAKLRDENSNWMVRCKVIPELNLLECMEYITLAEYLQLKEENGHKQLPIIQ